MCEQDRKLASHTQLEALVKAHSLSARRRAHQRAFQKSRDKMLSKCAHYRAPSKKNVERYAFSTCLPYGVTGSNLFSTKPWFRNVCSFRAYTDNSFWNLLVRQIIGFYRYWERFVQACPVLWFQVLYRCRTSRFETTVRMPLWIYYMGGKRGLP